MYTEEEEFNYDNYLDDENNSHSNKPFLDIRFILKVLLIIILIILIIFLVFKIKNNNANKKQIVKNDTTEQVSLVFDNNMNMVKEAAYEYYFKDGNLPTNVGDSKTISVKNLIDKKIIKEVVDSEGYVCGYNTSGATITKNKASYKLEVKVICSDKSDSKIYYYDLNGNCLTCNGETYNPENEIDNSVEQVIVSDFDSEDDKSDKVPVETEEIKVCKDFSDWSLTYPTGNNYEVETRTLVKGYKEEIQYGEWGEETTKEQIPSDTLEVKTSTKTTSVKTKTSWSKESTTKPSSKSGREISSRTETKTTTTTSCTEDRTYTRTLSKWDNSALSCKTIGIGKVQCTYKVKGTCTQVPKTTTVTYYKYRDTVTKKVDTTYYQSREIIKNKVYTGYILESEMPEGYLKLDGSEVVQYRYREKCSK